MSVARRIAAVAVAAAAVVSPSAQATATRASAARRICECYDLFRVRTDGTHRQLLSRGGSRELEDISRDMKMILFQERNGVLEVSTITGTGRHVVADAVGRTIRGARFSPDGTRVAYTVDSEPPCVGTLSIRVVEVDRSDDQSVVPGCAFPDAPAWSPDGRRIAYARSTSPDGGALSDLVAHDLATGAERVVSPRPGLIAEIAWSPAGDRVAYAEYFRGGAILHVVAVDGSGDRARTGGADAVWSPDGRLLAYQAGLLGIVVIARDGSHRRVVDRRAIVGLDWGFAWSPDGRRLAYRVGVKLRRGETEALWTARADGTHRHRVLTGVRGEVFGPVYWLSGTTLLYGRLIESGE